GGGVYSLQGLYSLYSQFLANRAIEAGGAASAKLGSSIIGSTLAYNTSNGCCGAVTLSGIYTNIVFLQQNTIAQNVGSPAVYAKAGSVSLYNNSIVNNSGNNPGFTTAGLLAAGDGPSAALTLSSNLISGNTNASAAQPKSDFAIVSGLAVGGDHNLITN